MTKSSDQASSALANDRDAVTLYENGRYISSSEAVRRTLRALFIGVSFCLPFARSCFFSFFFDLPHHFWKENIEIIIIISLFISRFVSMRILFRIIWCRLLTLRRQHWPNECRNECTSSQIESSAVRRMRKPDARVQGMQKEMQKRKPNMFHIKEHVNNICC